MKKMFMRITLGLLAVIIAAVPLAATALPVPPEENTAPDTSVSSPPVSATVAPDSAKNAATNDGSMETALVVAKTLIDVDDTVFTEFSYSSSYSNYETMEGQLWNFSWNAPDVGNIYATVSANGVLLSFGKYSWDEDSFGFAKIDKNAAIAKAGEFLKKANPDTYSFYKTPENTHTDIRSNEYSISYFAQINGYNFEAANITVRINKFSGEVVGYSTNKINPGRFKFEDASGIIDRNAAIVAYADKIGLSLEYKSYFDSEKKSIKIFPVYLFNSNGEKYIGAKSGDVVSYVYDLGTDNLYGSTDGEQAERAMADTAFGANKSSARLTPAEVTAIEQAAKFITGEQALKKLLEAAEIPNLDIGSFDEQYIGLNRDYIDASRYLYNVNLNRYSNFNLNDDDIISVYGNVDAVTGRVMSFHFSYYGYPSSGKTMTRAQAETVATTFLKKMAPAEYAKTKQEDIKQSDMIPYSNRGGFYYFNYVRYENNIPFRNNGISVTINEGTGKITDYSLDWYEKATFPNVSDVLAAQLALTEFVGQNGSKVNYITTGEGNVALVYDFKSQENIDPFTGKALDYTGQPWVDDTVKPDYSDAKGHWSEKYVTKLVDNGVFLWSGKFEPEKVMTELEFLQYLMLLDSSAYPVRSDAQAFFAQRGVKVEASPDKLLIRKEAVRIIAEYLGYKKLAEQYRWFVYPFTDSVDEAYKGYITICYMLGIVSGDGTNFNANGNITRAHAAVMLHNLILARS